MKFLSLAPAMLALLMLSACGDDDASTNDTGSEDTGNADAQDSGSDDTGTSDGGDTGGDACADLACVNGTCDDSNDPAACVCTDGWEGADCGTLTEPPQDGLVLWLDADDPTNSGVVAGSSIDVWVDRTGTTRNLTAIPGGEPSTVTVNGRTVASFDGADDALSVTGFSGLTDITHYTIIIVGKGRGLNQAFIGGVEDGSSDPGLVIETSSGSNARFLHRTPPGTEGGDEILTSSGALAADVLHRIWAVRSFDTPNRRVVLHLDDELGALNGTGDADNFASDLDLSIGTAGTGDGFLNGEIAEVLVYVGARSPNQNPELVAYLQQKWGVE